jgi:hypothetical protein
MSTITIGNLKDKNITGEYIGREWAGRKASCLANPYHIGKDGSRLEVILKYKKWLWEAYSNPLSPQRKELERLKQIQDLRLLCWCAPLPCHGDVIKSCLEWMD